MTKYLLFAMIAVGLWLATAADPPAAPSLDASTKLSIRDLQLDLKNQQDTMRGFEQQCMVLVNRQPEYTQAAAKAAEVQGHLNDVLAKATPKGYVLNPVTLVLLPQPTQASLPATK